MAVNRCILTIDQGTTRQKVALVDLTGRCLAFNTHRNMVRDEPPWGSIQDAEDWWRSACRLTRSIMTTENEVVAVTVSGRGGAAIGIDNEGFVTVNPWLDSRHQDYLRQIRSEHPGMKTYAATLLAKLVWLEEHHRLPADIMYAKDFLIYRLSGELVTDPTSGPDAASWPAATLEVAGPVRLPRIANPWDIVGHLQPSASETLGLPASIPIVLGGHDGICANVGVGALAPSTFALTLGTHCVTRAMTRDAMDPGVFRFYGMPPDRHVIGASAWYAGRAIEWFLDENLGAGTSADDQPAFESMDRAISGLPPGAAGATFFPYLGGQTSPRSRPHVRETFQGVTDAHTLEQRYQAVVEGSSFAIAESFAQMVNWMGVPDQVRVTGGGTANHNWLQTLADILGYPLEVSDALAECRGAAMFAAVALGDYTDYQEANVMKHISHTVDPDVKRQRVYAELLQQWSEASAALG